jgi:hypothetical protein
VPLYQSRPFAARLLHAILAEDALACVDRLIDRVSRNGLGHGDEPHCGGIAIGSLCGESDLLPDEAESRRHLAGTVVLVLHERLSIRLWPERNLTVPII